MCIRDRPDTLPAAVRWNEDDARVFQSPDDRLHRRPAWRAMTFLEVQQRLEVDARGGGKAALRNAKQATGTTALPGRNPVF